MSAELSEGRAAISQAIRDKLEIYEELLRKWNPKINLVAASSLANLWSRHFEDSLQLLEIAPVEAKTWVDLGSGGGFPGMVVAIAASEGHPSLQISLVESDQRKAAFLRTVSRETKTPVAIHSERAEALPPQRADVVSARALAPLPQLLALVERHLGDHGVALLPKGASRDKELAEARKNWLFDLESLPSRTEPAAALLKIGGLSRA